MALDELSKYPLFEKCITLHERSWGHTDYSGRPTLKDFLQAKIVAFWYPAAPGMPFTATIHKDIKEIDAYLTHMTLNTKQGMPTLRLDKLFMDKKQIKVKGIRVIYEYVPER